MLIAVIEDNEMIRKNLIILLEMNHFKTVSSDNGADGLKLIKKTKPILVLTDIMMPEMDGIDMVKQLRLTNEFFHIPIVFLTAKNSIEDRLIGFEAGAIDFISKPFITAELIYKIKNLTNLVQSQITNIITKPVKVKFDSNDHQFLDKLRTVIDKHIDSNFLKTCVLAVDLNMSHSAIHKKIKKITDKSTNQYIREYRLEKSKQMIEANYASISEIAFAVGFTSVSYFSKSYKNYFGYNPSNAKLQ
ncbi:MAG: response regulator transcription factor [Bacteroidia bacterium]